MKNFWRSYSFVLTLVFLLSVSFLSVSAATSDVNIYSIGTSAKSVLSSAFEDGLRNYFGRFSGSYPVAGPLTSTGGGTTISVSASSGFIPYLSNLVNSINHTVNGTTRAAQSILTKVGDVDKNLGYLTKGMSSTNGLIDILSSQSTTVDVSGIIKAIDADREQDLAYFKSLVSGFSRNHTDLTSGFSTNHTDLTGFKSQAHSDAIAIEGVLESFKPELLFTLPRGQYLNSNGWSVLGTNVPAYTYLTQGFLGVGAKIDSGFSNWTTQFQGEPTFWAQGDLWDSSSGEAYSETYGNFVWMLSDLMSLQQSDLAKLRYVLASDQDIEISKKNEPVKDAIEDNFVGDAPGAVKPDSVGDMAGISGGLQDSLNTGANAGDVLGFLNGSEGWGFWSQEVANGLHNVPASTADDEVSIYYGDIDSFEDLSFEDFAGIDFIHFYDPSALDDYLSRGDVS